MNNLYYAELLQLNTMCLMAEVIEIIKTWLWGLSESYGVNPVIFISIYVGATPFFLLSLAWLGNNFRKKKSLVLPIISTTLFYLSSYFYLFAVGKSIPVWVHTIIAVIIGVSTFLLIKKIRSKILVVPESTVDKFIDD